MKVGDRVLMEGSRQQWRVAAVLDGNRVKVELPSGAWLVAPESLLSPLYPPPGKAKSRRR